MSWSFGFKKTIWVDELRSRSRICLMILMICLDLMICIEEIEMEESQVEKGERVDGEERKYDLRSERKNY